MADFLGSILNVPSSSLTNTTNADAANSLTLTPSSSSTTATATTRRPSTRATIPASASLSSLGSVSLIFKSVVWISLFSTLFSLVAALPSSSQQIHTHMNKNELQQIFHVDSHLQVPEYEVVSIRSLTKRSLDEKRLVAFNAFGKDMRLSLRRNPHLVKQSLRMWIAEPDSTKGVHYEELPQEAEEDIGEAYQDENNQAALLIHHDKDDGSLLMDGMVGSNLVVKPIPTTFRSRVKFPDDDEAYLDEERGDEWVVKHGFPNMNDSTPFINNTRGMHIIYQTKHIDSHSDYALMEPDQSPFKFATANGKLYKNGGSSNSSYASQKNVDGNGSPFYKHKSSNRTKRHASRRKRDAPYVIYPEILVIVDYDGYRLHGGDNLQVKRYFVSFWNGVDLRYKVLKGPKVRISIAGIIISRGRDATPYLERNRVGRDALDSASALTDLGKYLFQERRLPVYDVAVVVTKYDMCRHREGGRCSRGTAGWICVEGNLPTTFVIVEQQLCESGFAYVGGACVVNKRLEKVNSVAIVEDTGGFSGIIVAAHEVGHLLGCVHDGSPAPSYLGGPGAQKCRWEDGFIMSDLRHTERGFQWSPCSIAQFHHFLNGDTATCLYNSPHEDGSLPRVLPGKLLSLDAQCRKDRGTSACFKDDRVCAQLFCFDATSGYCVAYRPAAEGSPCGDSHQHCVSGRCIIEHENIIPDYSQITTSVIRGDISSKGSPFSFPSTTPMASPWVPVTRTTSYSQPSYSHNYYPTPAPAPGGRCENRIDVIGGGLNCYEFLSRYAFKFCSSIYIQQNCCSAYKSICLKK